jgi:uncharacterized protein (TIGR02118 family)
MFKLIIAFRKKQGMSRDDFIQYYEGKHVPLAQKLLGVGTGRGIYRRNYIIADDPLLSKVGDGRSGDNTDQFDVITESIANTREEMEAGLGLFFSDEIFRKIKADEANFVEPGSVKFYVVEVRENEGVLDPN